MPGVFLPINFKHPYSPPSKLEEFTSTNSQPSLKGDYSFVPVQGYPLEPISHLAASGDEYAFPLKSHCPFTSILGPKSSLQVFSMTPALRAFGQGEWPVGSSINT